MVYRDYPVQDSFSALKARLQGSYHCQHLKEEGKYLSRRGIVKFINRYKERGGVIRKPGSGKWAKVTEEMKTLLEEIMREDYETTAVQLHHYLCEQDT